MVMMVELVFKWGLWGHVCGGPFCPSFRSQIFVLVLNLAGQVSVASQTRLDRNHWYQNRSSCCTDL